MSAAVEPAPDSVGEPMVQPVIELDDVHASYGQFQALFGITLRVGQGRALAVVGHNGMGKTTLARVASGLVVPTSGRVLMRGVDLTGRPAHEFALAGIAHATEGRSVFSSLTVSENLTLVFRRRFGRGGVHAALERVFELFPRLGERRTQLAGSLSGGEQRMLTLARVMVLEPTVLIADELSLGLAPIITEEVYKLLGRIKETGTSMIVIEQHVHHALDVCDDAVVIDRGLVVYNGPATDRDRLMAAFTHVDDAPADESPDVAPQG